MFAGSQLDTRLRRTRRQQRERIRDRREASCAEQRKVVERRGERDWELAKAGGTIALE